MVRQNRMRQDYFIDHLLMEHRLIVKGKSYDEVLAAAAGRSILSMGADIYKYGG